MPECVRRSPVASFCGSIPHNISSELDVVAQDAAAKQSYMKVVEILENYDCSRSYGFYHHEGCSTCLSAYKNVVMCNGLSTMPAHGAMP